MKKFASQFISFLSYHNAIPIAVSILFVGGASAFAATATGVLPLPTVPAIIAPSAPEEVDVSALLSLDVDVFDFHPTVTNVSETDDAYTVSYSLQTLAPQEGAWGSYEKTGEFSAAKASLGETGLQGYVVDKLRDIENGERQYLARAQEAEKKLANAREARPANAFVALIGLALDQIPVPVIAKPAPEAQPETPPVQNEEPQATEVSAHASSASNEASTLDAVSVATSTNTTPATSPDATTTPDTIVSSTASTTVAATSATSTTPQSASSSTNDTSSQPEPDGSTSSVESATPTGSQQGSQQDFAPEATAASTTPSD